MLKFYYPILWSFKEEKKFLDFNRMDFNRNIMIWNSCILYTLKKKNEQRKIKYKILAI